MSLPILLQYLLPHHLLSAVVRHATRWTWRPWKNGLIDRVVRSYHVDLAEAAEPQAHAYPHFNAFFTRALKPGARPAAADPAAILCPADGRISQAGPIRDGRIVQAKGRDYSVAELLADADAAAAWSTGHFATVYLSPRDYHRVHMPLDGVLERTTHVPGRLFSVAPFAVAGVPRLFARNERLVCHFRGPAGPFVVVMVGAMLVSGIDTVWSGCEVPPYARSIVHQDWRNAAVRLPRHAEMARFNMGSTVVLLLPPDCQLRADLHAETAVRMGEGLGRSDRLASAAQPAVS